MPVVMEVEAITRVTEFQQLLPHCMQCQRAFRPGDYALSLYERWRHRVYLVHAHCEAELVRQLESE